MRRKIRIALDFGLLRGFALLSLVGLSLLIGPSAGAESRGTRLALVIGNSDYDRLTPLKNAAGDAAAIGAKLESLGFDVALLTNASAPEFNRRLNEIVSRAETAETVLFYYAGHAFQMDGTNYLVPVGARLDSLEAVRSETWSLDSVIARLQHRKRQTLVFLDACRNDPRPASAREKGAAEGLARVQIGDSTYVAFATAPGMVTYDGAETTGRSPFTEALLANIGTPGQSISDMMIRVRNQVEQRTFRRQTPWEQSSLLTQFHFTDAAPLSLPSEALERLAQRPTGEREAAFDALRSAGVPDDRITQMRSRIDLLTEGLSAVDGTSGISFGAPKAPQAMVKPAPVTGDLFGNLPSASSAGSISFGRTEPELNREPPLAIVAAPPVAAPETIPGFPSASSSAASTPPIIKAPTEPVVTPPASPAPQLSVAAPAEAPPPAAENLSPARIAKEVSAAQDVPEAAALRLAALSPEVLGGTRGLPGLSARSEREAAAFVPVSLRLRGRELDPESREGCALLHAADPGRFAPCAPSAEELALQIQNELKRIGCYRGAIDGDWGPGSRAALAEFREEAALAGDETEPSAALLARLKAQPEDLCKPGVAALPVPPASTEPRRAAPPRPKPTERAPKPVVRSPAPKPAPAPVVTQRPSPSDDNRARARRIIN